MVGLAAACLAHMQQETRLGVLAATSLGTGCRYFSMCGRDAAARGAAV